MKMKFCGPNGTLGTPWTHNGFSRCFIETVSHSIIFGVMVIFGSIQIAMYRRYSTPLERNLFPKSIFYKIQVLAIVLMSLQGPTRLLLQLYLIEPKQIFVYQILVAVFSMVMWPLALGILCLERKRLLPSIPARGHGAIILLFWTLAFAAENMALISWFSPFWWWHNRNMSKDVELGLWISRYVCTIYLFVTGFYAPGIQKHGYGTSDEATDEESRGLLNEGENTDIRTSETGSTWSGFWKKMKMLWPFVWPKNNIKLQMCVLACLVLLVAGRVVNLFTPLYYKYIVDSLTVSSHPNQTLVVSRDGVLQAGRFAFRWDYVLMYVLLRFLQGGGGVGSMAALNNMRALLWIWVQQYTNRETGVELYRHLHSLSLRWHLSRKTGEVLRVMDRGTNSINSLLNYILFQIVPTMVDIIIALIYFLVSFNPWFVLIMFLTMALYLVATILVTEWRTKFRREMNKLDNERNTKGVDSLINFETVKYYNAEEFEVGRYREAIVAYQKAEWVSNVSLVILNMSQNIIITGGLAAGCLLCVYYVSEGLHGLTVGDFVLFTTYLTQLYAPLNWFGTYYRMIQQSFIDMENMFELFNEEQEVKDQDNALTMTCSKGMIEFNNVSFHYDPKKPILKNISFVVPPGQTVALVGPSGGGKSTIIRLLFRFYDIQAGFIRIDGQDISEVTQKSLRRAIGVVPQDTVLFNADIEYNIRYGRSSAPEDEVTEAARAADIHERILNFPEKYKTKVGERGLKLSGGEKQRVAIARTILKAPQFVLLDEATSALDTETERNIQTSLAKVCENKTTIIVAHRLSTITHADQILVLVGGGIVERGTHEELLSEEGEYWKMWQKQIQKHDTEDNGASSSRENSTEEKKDL